MTDSTRNVLVTGGAGYIGSITCKHLRRLGWNPITLDSLVRGHEWAVKWGPLIKVCLTDRDAVFDVFKAHRFQAVIHFAAFAYVGESMQNPAKYYRNNVVGSQNLLDAMAAHGVRKIVFSSTCATYGEVGRGPISEATRQQPINPYGRSKLMVEQMLEDYSSVGLIEACALRYFNAAGCDPDGEVGEWHDPEPHLIPNVLAAAISSDAVIKIFGADYPTPDGTCIRDYVHVDDLAQAHCLALDFLEQQSGFHAFNLGYGVGHSVKEVIEAARRVTGRPINVEVHSRRPGDPAVLVADAVAAHESLGWQPKWKSLTKTIATAWEWERRKPEFSAHQENRQ